MNVDLLHQKAKASYWKDKDLSEARRLLEEGIAAARGQGSRELEKPLQYDLASFCWPGWDESGIVISDDDLSVGEIAAAENLRLAGELERGDAALANAWFMVGGYRLVRNRYREAADAFAHQRGFAERGQDPAGADLAQGYASLAGQLGGGDEGVSAAIDRLRSSGWEHGPAFATQLETAARVFGG